MYSQVTAKKVKGVHIQSSSIGGGSYRKVTVGGYASSVYAGAGGLDTRISTSYGGVTRSSLQHGSAIIRINGNEKETMQDLNQRLSAYLEKVHSLEESNAQLEGQIREWYSKNSGTAKRDYNAYFETIEDLSKKIENAKMDNAQILLQIDNASLAIEDFKIKLENEQTLSASVENDIFKLRKIIDELTITKADLEAQIENLKEDLAYLKKNHDEEIGELYKQMGGKVDVEVDVAPSVDLAKIMEDMRTQYEQLVEKQRLEAKYWFDKKVEECNEEMHTSTTELEKYKKEVSELRHKAQELEIESQTEMSKKNASATTLNNVTSQYSMELAETQHKISSLEEQFQHIRRDISSQIYEFGILFDLKTRLETEISTYKSLLDGEAVRISHLLVVLDNGNISVGETTEAAGVDT
ncbi:keratin, type I cytoskeletal 19-like [Rhinophrynus dorsalis]